MLDNGKFHDFFVTSIHINIQVESATIFFALTALLV